MAIQDLRGRYKSEGTFVKYVNDPKDGYDTVQWLGKNLDYANGDVGMWGRSYGAHVQAGAAKLNPSHLKTIVVNMGGTSNAWTHAVGNHGAFELKQIIWAFKHIREATDNPAVKEMLVREKSTDWLTVLPLRKGLSPLAIAPNFEDYVIEMMTPQAVEKSITLDGALADSPPCIWADRDLLHQAAVNLVSNAIKYTREGGAICVQTSLDREASRVAITVTDNGIGIRAQDLPRIFDKFYRAREGTGVAKGTGLGLNLVKHIVETVHQGEISVTSEHAVGTTIVLRFPLMMN